MNLLPVVFEPWLHHMILNHFEFYNRFVGVWLNMTGV